MKKAFCPKGKASVAEPATAEAMGRTVWVELMVLTLPTASRAQFTYTTNADNTLTITGYHGPAWSAVSVPSRIQGRLVSAIGDGSFSVFVENSPITSITIPDSVTTLGSDAFDEDSGLTNVSLGHGLTTIGFRAFEDCFSLASITTPRSVTNIGGGAFLGCGSLSDISVEPENQVYSSLGGVLFDKNQTILIDSPQGIGGSYTVPNTVRTIAYEAFYLCGGISNVVIADSVTEIGEGAFTCCSGLGSVTIGKGVFYLASSAFFSPLSVNNLELFFRGDAPAVGDRVFGVNQATAYYLPGTTGWPEFSANNGIPAVLWNPLVQADTLGARSNQFGFNIAGSTNIPVVVEACANLSNPVWTPLQSFNLTNGLMRFSDAQWTNAPARFYRMRTP